MLLIAGLAAFAHELDAPFYFDDQEAIVGNPHIRDLGDARAVLTAPPQSAVAGRPVVGLTLAVNYAIGGLQPSGYRWWNLAVHLVNALLLFGVLRHAFTRTPFLSAQADPLAFAAALLWLVHPLQTEVIGYVVQRSESMMATFYLVTLHASIRAMEATRGAGRWTVCAVVSCALGMATKESMVTAPLMVLLYDAVFAAGSISRAIRRRLALYLGLAASTGVLAALIASGPRWRSAGFSSGVTPWEYLLNQAVMIVTYLRLSIWPSPLVFDYGPTQPIELSVAAPYLAVVAALVVATVFAWTRWPRVALAATWVFVTLAPASSVVPIATEVGAERRMYLPLAGIAALFVGGGWVMLAARRAAAAPLRGPVVTGAIGLAAVAIALASASAARLRDYRDPVRLWTTVVEARPHGRARYSLGLALAAAGRTAAARTEYERAAADFPDAHHALGVALIEGGRSDEALAHLREFVRLRPDDYRVPPVYALLGRAFRDSGRLDEAAAALRESLRMNPRSLAARIDLADVLIDAGRYVEAEAAYRAALQLEPGRASVLLNLGLALIGQGREADAAVVFGEAVRAAPDNPDARLNHGHALAGLGRFEDAAREYRAGLAAAPRSVALHNALGLVLAAQGRRAEALSHFEASLTIDPGNQQTRADHADALMMLGVR